jgi:hypothetical protein
MEKEITPAQYVQILAELTKGINTTALEIIGNVEHDIITVTKKNNKYIILW